MNIWLSWQHRFFTKVIIMCTGILIITKFLTTLKDIIICYFFGIEHIVNCFWFWLLRGSSLKNTVYFSWFNHKVILYIFPIHPSIHPSIRPSVRPSIQCFPRLSAPLPLCLIPASLAITVNNSSTESARWKGFGTVGFIWQSNFESSIPPKTNMTLENFHFQ